MTVQRTRSVGLTMALSCSMVVLLSSGFVAGASARDLSIDCIFTEAVGDGVCDMLNNNKACGASWWQ